MEIRPSYGAYGCGPMPCSCNCYGGAASIGGIPYGGYAQHSNGPISFRQHNFYGSSDSRADAIKSAYKWAGGGVAEKLVTIADRLGADAYDIANLINFESGGNPKAKNKISDATGIIQWIPSTAKRFGVTTAQIYQMSALQQLDLMEQYFAPYKGRLNTVQGVFMAVFYPKAMGWSLDTAFPSKVQEQNPGIKVVGDYIKLATKRAKLPGSNERVGQIVETAASYNPILTDAQAARVGGLAARSTRQPWLAAGAAGMAIIAILALLARNRAKSVVPAVK